MEISPAYVDVAVERWQVETGTYAVLEEKDQPFARIRAERLGTEREEEAA
jgi:hypothetical protein